MSQSRVLLVYPYFYTGAVMDQLFSPLGIAQLAAGLRQQGVEVQTLDCTFLDFETAVQRATDFQPDVTGIYVMTTMAHPAIRLLEHLRQANPRSLQVTGGPLPTLYPARFAERFDFVFRGEAALSFPAFCRDYLAAADRAVFLRGLEPDRYAGLYGTRLTPIDTPAVHLTQSEIDACPLPDRSGFDHVAYQRVSQIHAGCRRASVMLTYGCPFSCSFCSKPVFGSCVRFRSLDRVFAEITDIVGYGYNALWIADDLFTYDAAFLQAFCVRFRREFGHLTWSCLSRVDSITDAMAAAMREAGCTHVYLGIESGNDAVLHLMNKRTSTAAIRSGVDVFRRNGIACTGFFIVGYPGETIATIEETLAFALSLGLTGISFNVPYPLPGSRLYEQVSGVSDDDWTIENETRFLYASEFDETWLRARIQDTTDRFRQLSAAGVRSMTNGT